MKVKHTTYLHIKFSQHIVIVKTRLYRLTRNRMVLPRNRTRSARRLPLSLEQSHNSTGTALNDPTTQGAPHSKRERRLGTRQFMRDFPDFVCMPAFSCSSIHFIHFAVYRIIFGVGNFSRGFFVYSERKCSIFVSVLFCFYLLRL